MHGFNGYLQNHTNKTLLAIFAHPDDESFVAGGLFQVAKKLGYKTVLVCLTCGEKGKNAFGVGKLKFIRPHELAKAVALLDIDKIILRDYPDAGLREANRKWGSDVSRLLKHLKPGIVVTFDHSGLTAHPDHISLSVELLKIIKKDYPAIQLFWRTHTKSEKLFLSKCGTLDLAQKTTYPLKLTFKQRLIKLRAIYAHKSQMKSLPFKFLIIIWHLFEKYEPYYQVNLKKKYVHRYVPFEI